MTVNWCHERDLYIRFNRLLIDQEYMTIEQGETVEEVIESITTFIQALSNSEFQHYRLTNDEKKQLRKFERLQHEKPSC